MTTPRYVNPLGVNGSPQPFYGKDMDYYGFMLEADHDKLNDLCDTYLTKPSGGAVRYIALIPYVLVICADIKRLGSVNPPISNTVWSKEKEIDFAIVAAAVKKVGNVEIIDHLAWFMPYLFVDNSIALIAGREIFGFPKEMGWMTFPDDPANPDHFSMDTLAAQTFSADSELTRQTLLDITRIEKSDKPVTPIDSIAHLYEIGTETVFPDGNIVVPGFEFFISMLEGFIKHETFMVFLKQFPDITNGANACYQAVTEAPMKTENFQGGHILHDTFEINLRDFPTQPILKNMGLKMTDGKQTASFAFYFKTDFEIGTGKTIWQSTIAPPEPSGCLPSWLRI